MTTLAIDDAIRQALALFRSGALPASKKALQQILAVRPDHPDALALRGLIAYEQGDFEDAERWHQRSIAIRPGEALYICNLATTFTARARFSEATDCYERALSLRQDHPEALAGKADVLERQGAVDEAAALLRPIVESGHATPRIIVVYARLLLRRNHVTQMLALATSHLEGTDFDAVNRRSLLFILGSGLDRLRENDRAFAILARANAIGAQPYDPSAVERKYRTLRRFFSRSALAAMPRATRSTELPVFVIGMPRSGTTLVEQIIQAHPCAFGAGEIPDLAEIIRHMPQVLESGGPYPDCVRHLTAEGIDRLAGLYLQRLRRRSGSGARRVVDKTIANVERVGLISRLLPEARIVHVRRDPLDNCLSCFMRDLSPPLHPWSTDLASIGRHYRAFETLMRFWQEDAGITMLDVKYESLVSEPGAEIRRLIDFIGLPWDERCLDFHRARRDVATISYDQVRRPLTKAAIGRYRRYERHLDPLRAALR